MKLLAATTARTPADQWSLTLPTTRPSNLKRSCVLTKVGFESEHTYDTECAQRTTDCWASVLLSSAG